MTKVNDGKHAYKWTSCIQVQSQAIDAICSQLARANGTVRSYSRGVLLFSPRKSSPIKQKQLLDERRTGINCKLKTV